MIAPDGIGHVARFLADHPEGILPGKHANERGGLGFDFKELINKCDDFVELTGEIGDVSFPFQSDCGRWKRGGGRVCRY
jgi:hypothetical protein